MGKLAQSSAKYVIKATMKADGTVEKPDVVGAIFGQTEGLLGPDLDLRELQMTGRIGRIDVNVKNKGGNAKAKIQIPSSLDATETSLIAAALETIDRVGPCSAKIKVKKVEDVRVTKRDYIIDRAKELLENVHDQVPETVEIAEEIKEEVRVAEVTQYKGLHAGPNVNDSDEAVICEGRADVVTLLKNGVKNAVALGGTSVPSQISDICNRKNITVFLDGDRGGDLILKELRQSCDIDHVARAPKGKEVEELTKKEIFKALRDKMPFDQYMEAQNGSTSNSSDGNKKENNPNPAKNIEIPSEKQDVFEEKLEDLVGTRAVYVLDKDLETLGKVPVSEAYSALPEMDDAYAILLDGYIDKKFVELAEDLNATYLIGNKVKTRKDSSVKYLTKDQM